MTHQLLDKAGSVSYWLEMTVSQRPQNALNPPQWLWLEEAASPFLPPPPQYLRLCSSVLYAAVKQEARWEMDAVGKK